jgi:hypothetical protein
MIHNTYKKIIWIALICISNLCAMEMPQEQIPHIPAVLEEVTTTTILPRLEPQEKPFESDKHKPIPITATPERNTIIIFSNHNQPVVTPNAFINIQNNLANNQFVATQSGKYRIIYGIQAQNRWHTAQAIATRMLLNDKEIDESKSLLAIPAKNTNALNHEFFIHIKANDRVKFQFKGTRSNIQITDFEATITKE